MTKKNKFQTRIIGTILILSMSWSSVAIAGPTEDGEEKADPIVGAGVMAGSALVTGTAFILVGFLTEEDYVFNYQSDGRQETETIPSNRDAFLIVGGALLIVASFIGALSHSKRKSRGKDSESVQVKSHTRNEPSPVNFELVYEGILGSGVGVSLAF